jgi:hypothetical protein
MDKNEALEKYGNVPLTFTSYYKYVFHFSGLAEDGNAVCCSFGGDSSEVYRFQVTPNTQFFLKDDEWWSATISTLDGILLWQEFNW